MPFVVLTLREGCVCVVI